MDEDPQLSICMVEVGGKKRRTLECSVPAVTPLTSRGRLASWSVNPATCQDLILLQVSEDPPPASSLSSV